MTVAHVVVFTGALLVLLALPCALAAALRAPRAEIRRAWACTRRRHTRVLCHLDRDLPRRIALPAPRREPTVEELAADLCRLHRRRGDRRFTGSAVLRAAVLRAYDTRLVLVSRRLGVPEHLTGLTGLDRDLERVRLEEELHSVGLRLRSTA